jgi:hypothetical protein
VIELPTASTFFTLWAIALLSFFRIVGVCDLSATPAVTTSYLVPTPHVLNLKSDGIRTAL